MKKAYPLIMGMLLCLLLGLTQAQSEAVMSIPREFPERPFIFFMPSSERNRGDIYLAYQDGLAPILLTEETVNDNFLWSPDGRWLAYQRVEGYREGERYFITPYDGSTIGVYVFDFLSGNKRILDEKFHIETLALGVDDRSIQWADDSVLSFATTNHLRYYFFDMLSPGYGYWEMPSEYRLTDDNFVSFINRNRWLLTNLSVLSQGVVWEIAIRDMNYGRPIPLLEDGPSSIDSLLLSPDGLRIAYTYVEDDSPHIAVMSMDGTNQDVIFELSAEEARELSEDSPFRMGGSVSNLLHSLNWSPDGSTLSFFLNRALYTIRVDGTELEAIESMSNANGATWLSNDLLQVQMPVDSDVDEFLLVQRDGSLIEPVRFGGEPVSWIEVLPPNASVDMFAYLKNVANQGFDIAPTAIPATPTSSPTPFPVFCDNAPPSRVGVGDLAYVTISEEGQTREDLRVRNEPNGERIGAMAEGTQFRIVGGPICAEGLSWWEIETLDGSLRGWSAEGIAPDDYFIAPER